MADTNTPPTLESELDTIYGRAEEDTIQPGAVSTGGERALTDNPLISLDQDQLKMFGRAFVDNDEHGIDKTDENYAAFEVGAMLAGLEPRDPIPPELGLNAQQLEAIDREKSLWESWPHFPRKMKFLITACGLAAATQGWNETAVNGANIFYKTAFGLEHRLTLYGFVNAAPYASCALLTYWSTTLFNHVGKGRRGAIAWTLGISFITCLIQSFSTSWKMMLAFRLLLGVGMGPKSALVPMYSAETAPARIRGTIVMLWQVCTAIGIMLGLLCGIIFYNTGDGTSPSCTGVAPEILLSMKCSLHWRVMVGSPIILPLVGLGFLWVCPESPRWYMKNKKSSRKEAFQSLCELRETKLQAARDLFLMHSLLYLEGKVQKQDSFVAIFKSDRNWRAMTASGIVMFLQQLCGINVLIYYSSEVLLKATKNQQQALGASVGIGLFNVAFALPAFLWIDKRGRRFLLLVTFPAMAVCMLWTSQAFKAEDIGPQTGLVLTGMYLFTAFYSFGEGPVPFTYNAECHALHIRERGMALAVSITWLFNFGLSLTWPKMSSTMGAQGAFLWYMGWNIIGFFLVFLFVPETKEKTLEELDRVFRSPTMGFQVGINKIVATVIATATGQGLAKAPPVGGNRSQSASPEPVGGNESPKLETGEKGGASATDLSLVGQEIPER